jgi:uncharacterized protein (UPF0264 family)
MRLLVSVKNAEEAAAAVDGGADIIDAKDPAAGALGAVALPTFHQIVAAVAGARPTTAALGDAVDDVAAAGTAEAFALAGARFVKIGFSGVTSVARASTLLSAARQGAAGHARVIAAAYADAGSVGCLEPFAVLDAAVRAGVAGVLLDTADKQGPGLRTLMSLSLLRGWVTAAREAGLLTALAGRLSIDDLRVVSDAAADIVGVRGAVCEGGRTGRVTRARVYELRSVLTPPAIPAPAPAPAAACE